VVVDIAVVVAEDTAEEAVAAITAEAVAEDTPAVDTEVVVAARAANSG